MQNHNSRRTGKTLHKNINFLKVRVTHVPVENINLTGPSAKPEDQRSFISHLSAEDTLN